MPLRLSFVCVCVCVCVVVVVVCFEEDLWCELSAAHNQWSCSSKKEKGRDDILCAFVCVCSITRRCSRLHHFSLCASPLATQLLASHLRVLLPTSALWLLWWPGALPSLMTALQLRSQMLDEAHRWSFPPKPTFGC
jgi:hypothetical protein